VDAVCEFGCSAPPEDLGPWLVCCVVVSGRERTRSSQSVNWPSKTSRSSFELAVLDMLSTLWLEV
jgi:hypothetical protein